MSISMDERGSRHEYTMGAGRPPNLDGVTRLGKYVVDGVLGRGSSATVASVHAEGSRKQLALKVFSPCYSHERSALEAEIHERLAGPGRRNPHLVAFHNSGTVVLPNDGEVQAIAMQQVGVSVGVLLDNEGPLPPQRAVDITAQTAQGVAAMHNAGYCHGDIKRDNVYTDGSEKVIVGDFGTAGKAPKIETGEFASFTASSAAPEQWRGVTDTSSDTYALTLLLYRVLTAEPFFPPDEKKFSWLALKDKDEYHDLVAARAAQVPGELEGLVKEGLAIEPDDRPTPVAFAKRAQALVKDAEASSKKGPVTIIDLTNTRVPIAR